MILPLRHRSMPRTQRSFPASRLTPRRLVLVGLRRFHLIRRPDLRASRLPRTVLLHSGKPVHLAVLHASRDVPRIAGPDNPWSRRSGADAHLLRRRALWSARLKIATFRRHPVALLVLGDQRAAVEQRDRWRLKQALVYYRALRHQRRHQSRHQLLQLHRQLQQRQRLPRHVVSSFVSTDKQY